mmetsp:Transcript_16522/g.33647  ORF Transcript_16522/g.33647 Transcript_16522/m.33647 type:complete len:99 (-) Transcript_16522:458-754(-)
MMRRPDGQTASFKSACLYVCREFSFCRALTRWRMHGEMKAPAGTRRLSCTAGSVRPAYKIIKAKDDRQAGRKDGRPRDGTQISPKEKKRRGKRGEKSL